mmetsp:Transcript_42735/g.65637  ORF Transcript_42735/g.65637 Transcript_42735/m.65637 type:complete len:142 (+) Transcript_42735:1232-1657(+)
MNAINDRSLNRNRAKHNIRVIDPQSDEDEHGPELFIAQPTDDIPRNKLVEKLARGLQAYVQRMQKRESFYVTVVKMEIHSWQPAPRECSTLTSVTNRAYLTGGLNFDANREISLLKIKGLEVEDMEYNEPEWRNMQYESAE